MCLPDPGWRRGAQATLASQRPDRQNAAMLRVNDLTYRIGDRLILDAASFTIPEGARVGLVGRNGAGKTTLFKAILGDLSVDAKSISLPKGMRIGAVAQEAPAGPETLHAVVLAADTERARLMAEAEHADGLRRAEIETRLVDIGAHSAPARAAAILHGLGFDAAAQSRPCADFSGGWRMRVALAAVLFSEPDLLLLDEPTNYLDIEGTLWLYDYLERYPRTAIIISHDRDLLDTSVDHILHLDRGKLAIYRGGYTSFAKQLSEKRVLQAKAKAKQDVERAHLQSFIDRFKAKATKARQAQSRMKRLAKMEPIAALARGRRAGDPPAEPGEAAVAADRRHGAGEGRLRGPDRPQRARSQPRPRRPGGAARRQRKRQIDLLQADRRPARSPRRRGQALLQDGGRLLRPAPARRAAPVRERLRACPDPDAGRAGGEGPRRHRPARLRRQQGRHAGGETLGRREGAAADGARRLPRPASADPRRADQPPRHREPAGPGRGDQRLRGRRHPGRATTGSWSRPAPTGCGWSPTAR